MVYDHPEMFESEDNLLHVFEADPGRKGAWRLSQSAIERADEAGTGFKTERGDRAAMLVTPERGPFSQMMLGVTRSLGDFYHHPPRRAPSNPGLSRRRRSPAPALALTRPCPPGQSGTGSRGSRRWSRARWPTTWTVGARG